MTMSRETKTEYQLTPEQQELAAKLTHLQKWTMIHCASGMSKMDAYVKAGGKAKGKSANNVIGKMLEKGSVRAFYDSLVSSAAAKSVMTREEALETLTKIARTTVKDVVRFKDAQVGEDEDGNPVYQTVWQLIDQDNMDDGHAAAIAELSTGRDGFKFKLHSQTGAIKQLSELEGWDAPKKVEGNLTLDGNVDSPEIAKALGQLLDKL
jgi:phage terminase small subunit